MKKRKILLLGGWLLLLALSVLWRLPNIDTFGANNDEGAYLMWARLVVEGYPLYSQTHSVSAPLFIEMLAMVFRLFGFGVVLGRVVILSTFVLTAGVFAWLSHRIAGWVGAYGSLVILAITPQFFRLSREVMAEVPATLFVMLAIVFAYIYFEKEERRWLFLSGITFAISLMMKALYPAAGVPIAYFIFRNGKSWRNKIIDASFFGIATLATLVVIVSPYPWPDFFDQAVKFRTDLRTAFPLSLSDNSAFILKNLSFWSLWIWSGFGAIVSIDKIRTQAWLVWLLASITLALWQTPLFWQHITILLPPIILLSLEVIPYIKTISRHDEIQYIWLRKTIFAIMLLVTLFNIPKAIAFAQWKIEDTGISGGEFEAVEILSQVTRGADFVISDSQKTALFADKLTPPPMGDIANVAIVSGKQTPETLIETSNQYHIQAVLVWTNRLSYLPSYLDWAEQNFFVHKKWDNWHQLYFGRKYSHGEPMSNNQFTHFGDSIMLRGYSIDTEKMSAGETLPITLYWQGTQAIETSYTIFSHVLNADGALVAQMDSLPIYGYYPTNQWVPDEIVPDRMDIPLPTDLPSGTYSVIVGMYDVKTMKRLSQPDGRDFIQLGTIVLE